MPNLVIARFDFHCGLLATDVAGDAVDAPPHVAPHSASARLAAHAPRRPLVVVGAVAPDAVDAVEVVAVAAELALDAVDAHATPGDHSLAARHAALGPHRPVVPCRAVLRE